MAKISCRWLSESFHFHFTLLIMIQISANIPILANTQKSFKNPPPTLVEKFLIPFFELTQTWKTAPTENYKILNSSNKLFCLYLYLLKQLPFYGKTIKSRIKKCTNAKLLSELPFFEKPKKAKIKQLTIKNLLQEQPFSKQPIEKPCIKKLSNQELLRELPFYDKINILRNKRTFRGYAETYKVEIINYRNLSDLLSVIKNSLKNLFDELLREKRGFKYIISAKITLKKRINDNEFDLKHFILIQ